ncbi:MAG: DUF763 domain-containing protein [Dehalococcoidia bacterium]
MPRWLFERMTKLAREVSSAIVVESGPEEMLRRMADPYWFQAFGCLLGFDWHSSGVTTTLCAALKEGIRGLEQDLGLFIAGGKGRTSRQTPDQIESFAPFVSADTSSLVRASRMAAKVDSVALQDGYQLYHHTFLFTSEGAWTVIQQGMNEATRYARRYHWLGEEVEDFVCEPHAAICCDHRGQVLNLTASESTSARTTIAQIAAEERPENILKDLKRIKSLDLPPRHYLTLEDIHPQRLEKIFFLAHERKPQSFEELIGLEGVGPKTLRALSLVAELVHGVPSSFRDPVRYSFAHGGKDGSPYPVDRETYDKSIEILALAVRKAKLGRGETAEALRRLGGLQP